MELRARDRLGSQLVDRVGEAHVVMAVPVLTLDYAMNEMFFGVLCIAVDTYQKQSITRKPIGLVIPW